MVLAFWAKIKGMFTSKRGDVDMTEGGIAANILRFAFPLLLGNLFQQLYNMVDTWVIGQNGDNSAYAAVGSVAPVINMLIGIFVGFASGAGVIISQYYGAKQYDKVKSAVHTSFAMTLVMVAAFTVIGVAMTPVMLNLMLDASDGVGVFEHARTYLTIYFSGVFGLMIYNIGSGILRAVGDSTRPFFFLVVSALTNTVLDLVFVFNFGMGVAGVALATVIAQALSALLTVITLLRTDSCVKLIVKDIKFDFPMLGKIVKIGIPAAIQMALTAFSNVFVQSYIANINGNQEIILSGWTSYSKIDQFIFLPVQSISLGVTTFVGQNLGVHNEKRARQGARVGFLMSLAATVTVIAVVMIFAPYLAGIFNPDADVVACATTLLLWITPFYVCCCVNQVLSAALRGAGNTRAPMFIMLGTFVLFRQIYLFVMTNFISNELIPVAMSYPAGWLACSLCTFLYYKFVGFRKNSVAVDVKA